jgi:hypothetical protein
VTATEDPTTASDMVDVPLHNNVAQRNVQVGDTMTAEFGNPYSVDNSVTVRLSERGKVPRPYTLTTAWDQDLFNVWSSQSSDVFVTGSPGGELVLNITAGEVTLPAVTLPRNTFKTFTVSVDTQVGMEPITIDVFSIINDKNVGGMTLNSVPPVN